MLEETHTVILPQRGGHYFVDALGGHHERQGDGVAVRHLAVEAGEDDAQELGHHADHQKEFEEAPAQGVGEQQHPHPRPGLNDGDGQKQPHHHPVHALHQRRPQRGSPRQHQPEEEGPREDVVPDDPGQQRAHKRHQQHRHEAGLVQECPLRRPSYEPQHQRPQDEHDDHH